MASILIIDDDESIRRLLTQLLRHFGHTTVEAVDGAEGVRLYRAQSFDLVLTDLVMPGKDGLQVINEIHRLSPGAGIVAMSGGNAPLAKHLSGCASGHGICRVLPKPFSVAALQSIVSEMLMPTSGPSPKAAFRDRLRVAPEAGPAQC